MKNKEFASLAAKIFVPNTEFVIKAPLVLMKPIDTVLRGYCFDRSSNDADSFYIWAFFMPTFVPSTTVYFNLGWRISRPDGGYRWDTEMPDLINNITTAIKSSAVPTLGKIQSPLDVVNTIAEQDLPKDPYVQQARAYSVAKSGDKFGADRELRKLVEMLDINIEWQRGLAERAELLKMTLAENSIEIESLFAKWRDETLHNLKLIGKGQHYVPKA